MSTDVDVVIVGAGPAGSAAAISIVKRSLPAARRLVVVDSASFPRYKPCGGGVTSLGMEALERLGLPAPQLPHCAVREVRVATNRGTHAFARRKEFFRVYERAALDAWLVEQARELGVEVREGFRVVDVRRQGQRIQVVGRNGMLECNVVVAADGANSLVARKLTGRPVHLARLVETSASCDPSDASSSATFDFSIVTSGIAGYRWQFPAVRDGSQHVNIGVYDSRTWPRPTGMSLLDLVQQGSGNGKEPGQSGAVHAHALRAFSPRSPAGGTGLLLVGDALGVDSLLGEGISIAWRQGHLAGRALVESGFDPHLAPAYYERALRSDSSWRILRSRAWLSQLAYHRRGEPIVNRILQIAGGVDLLRR